MKGVDGRVDGSGWEKRVDERSWKWMDGINGNEMKKILHRCMDG